MQTRLYFESKYNSSSNRTSKEAFKSNEYQQLKQQLLYSALACGSPIVSNGRSNDRRFTCGVCYRKNKSVEELNMDETDGYCLTN